MEVIPTLHLLADRLTDVYDYLKAFMLHLLLEVSHGQEAAVEACVKAFGSPECCTLHTCPSAFILISRTAMYIACLYVS